jgi:hypothetical protein
MDLGIRDNDFDKLRIRVLTVFGKIINGAGMFIERPNANPKQEDSQ